jgi:hypothetical protein
VRRAPFHDGLHEDSDDRASVVCLKGRGEFDGLVAAILAQLLHRRGIEVTSVSAERFLRRRADEVRADRRKVVCVLTLQWRDSPPYLLNLVSRLRARSANVIMGIALADASDVAHPSAQGQPEAAGPANEGVIRSFATLAEACAEALRARSKLNSDGDAQAKGNQLIAKAL